MNFRLIISDVLSFLGPIDEEMTKCKKIFQYKAMEIYKALKGGKMPKRRGPKKQINNENINDNNSINNNNNSNDKKNNIIFNDNNINKVQ
jgi:hypothetical protein